jgi:hypothetical protein
VLPSYTAFSVPVGGQGNLGRNALSGFGTTQRDMTIRRQFRLTAGTSLQTRVDVFNVLNHPNLGGHSLSSPQFEQSTPMLAGFLGRGGQGAGVNPLYQIGGTALDPARAQAPVLSERSAEKSPPRGARVSGRRALYSRA